MFIVGIIYLVIKKEKRCKVPCVLDNEVEDVSVDNGVENEQANKGSDNDNTGDDIELPSTFPSDVPLPGDSIVTIFSDEEIQGNITVNTSMTLEDLEALYDNYHNGHPLLDEVEKDFYDEEEYEQLNYSVYNDEITFLIKIFDYGDLRTVHLTSIIP